MSPHLPLIALYSAGLIALGLFLGRKVKSTSGFFVANRSLSAGLIFSTVLAANIGAGSTVGATGLGYRYGLSAWWWNGSAGIGSLILALWIGPRIWRQASKFGFLTVGDLLEHHFGPKVRATISSILWFATLAILAGQIIGIGLILNVVAGLPKAAGCVVGGVLVTSYFTAGGLHGSAWVNMVQLTVKLAGFAIALPGIWFGAGGWDGLMRAAPSADYGAFWHGTTSASFLVLLVPAFMSSPGLLQKAYGGKHERAVRTGIGLNALALLAFGFIPALLGMAARLHHPGLPQELALPTLLARDLPLGLGSLLLAAIFSAELSASDAALFMLSTSLSQDLLPEVLQARRPRQGGAPHGAHRGDGRRGARRRARHASPDHCRGTQHLLRDARGLRVRAGPCRPLRAPEQAARGWLVGRGRGCLRGGRADRAGWLRVRDVDPGVGRSARCRRRLPDRVGLDQGYFHRRTLNVFT